jgi:hypothetical protein
MARYEDYVQQQEGGLEAQIDSAGSQQQERQRNPDNGQFVASTPDVDWEQRYKELEKHNSRQAQTLGEYRSTIDEFINNPTPSASQEPEPELEPITPDDLYTDPNAAISRAVDQHPAVREAIRLKEDMALQGRQQEAAKFADKHPDFKEVHESPEFQNWVYDNPTHQNLYAKGQSYDFSAADALFSLYKAEKGMANVRSEQTIQQAELVSSSGEMVQTAPKFSRSEYVDKLTRARQGDLECENWVKRNAAGYREALGSGNVRD